MRQRAPDCAAGGRFVDVSHLLGERSCVPDASASSCAKSNSLRAPASGFRGVRGIACASRREYGIVDPKRSFSHAASRAGCRGSTALQRSTALYSLYSPLQLQLYTASTIEYTQYSTLHPASAESGQGMPHAGRVDQLNSHSQLCLRPSLHSQFTRAASPAQVSGRPAPCSDYIHRTPNARPRSHMCWLRARGLRLTLCRLPRCPTRRRRRPARTPCRTAAASSSSR